MLRSYRARFSFVHIRRFLQIGNATSESQAIPTIQAVFGWTLSALSSGKLNIAEEDVDRAINDVISASQQTLRDSYETAIRSNNSRALFRQVLTACALAKVDDAGYFMPAAVRDPLANILKRKVEIATFQDTLKAFAESRGHILDRAGTERTFRFRFSNPAMQPYVIMRGVDEDIVDEAARQALSSPEQPDLFSNASGRRA